MIFFSGFIRWQLCLVCPFLFIAFLSIITGARGTAIRVNVDDEGGFSIDIGGQRWFSSRGDSVFLRSGGALKSVENGKLQFKGTSRAKGSDGIGYFTETQINYVVNDDSVKSQTVHFVAKIKVYAESDAIVFEQHFPNGVLGSSSGDADGLISGFPSFEIRDDDGGKGSAHWISWYYGQKDRAERRKLLIAPGFLTPTFVGWSSNTTLPGGIGGSGVTAIYNEDASTTVILSPFENVMTISHASPQPGIVQYGVMGNVTEIPPNYSIKTIMYISNAGINGAMQGWGKLLRKYFTKPDASVARARDITLQYLGLTTDNGAYYYYWTEPGLDYMQTLVSYHQYATRESIPIKYVLLDSWWYYKGSNGGVSEWSPRPEIFPQGLEALYQATGWFVQAHNRYWSMDTVYAKQNGGKYNWVMSPKHNGSAPLDQGFWDDLFSVAKSSWGLRVYEQDWLYNEFYIYVSQMLENVDLGRTWLLQMGQGAQKNDLTIQYCMPHIRHLLQSLEVSAVTQARASDDYVVSPYEGVDNWRIGGQSMLIDALGLAPSKDSFWSTSAQPGNPYGVERYGAIPRLEAVVTTLSAGPYAVADGIGYVNKNLVMRSVMADGRLIQPSSPATPIDISILQQTFGGNHGPTGEVWFAPSVVSGGSHRFGYLLAAGVEQDFEGLIPSHLGYTDKYASFYAFDVTKTEVSDALPSVLPFSSSQPLTIKKCGLDDFSLWAIIPQEDNGWALLGELNKWVGVSGARFTQISSTTFASGSGNSSNNSGIEVTIKGVEGEIVEIGFVSPTRDTIKVKCTIPNTQTVTITTRGECQTV